MSGSWKSNVMSVLMSGKGPAADLFSFPLAFRSLSQLLSTSCIYSFSSIFPALYSPSKMIYFQFVFL